MGCDNRGDPGNENMLLAYSQYTLMSNVLQYMFIPYMAPGRGNYAYVRKCHCPYLVIVLTGASRRRECPNNSLISGLEPPFQPNQLPWRWQCQIAHKLSALIMSRANHFPNIWFRNMANDLFKDRVSGICLTVTNEKCTYFERLCRMSPFVGIENSEE